MSVEALLVLSGIVLLAALIFAGGIGLVGRLRQTEGGLYNSAGRLDKKEAAPATIIRQTDFVLDMGYSFKELIPGWISEAQGGEE